GRVAALRNHRPRPGIVGAAAVAGQTITTDCPLSRAVSRWPTASALPGAVVIATPLDRPWAKSPRRCVAGGNTDRPGPARRPAGGMAAGRFPRHPGPLPSRWLAGLDADGRARCRHQPTSANRARADAWPGIQGSLSRLVANRHRANDLDGAD